MPALIAAFSITMVSLLAIVQPAGAQGVEPEDGRDIAQQLADKHAPVMVVKAQDAPCDTDGEPYGPTSVDIVLGNPQVLLRQVGNADPVLVRGPDASDLFGLGEGFFLDFPGVALEPGCIYEKDFDRFAAGRPSVVYAHIVQQEDRPDLVALQYWFYWYFNDWNNKHESDWEGIQLLFEASSVAEALASEPVSVGYAQHEGGERAEWTSDKLERVGDRPVVYASAGSHASYFGSALYIGRSAGEGFGCDNTDGPSERLDPEVVVLPDRVDDPDDPLAWLAFEGRWGERQRGPFNGPTGPQAKERWLEPVDWHENLRASSVVIPSGDTAGTEVIGAFCAVVDFGSGAVIQMTFPPTRLAATAALMALAARWLIRRTDWSEVEWMPVRRRRRVGQILRASGSAFRGQFGALAGFALVYVPTVVLAGFVAAVASWLPLIGDFLDLAGTDSGTGLFAYVAVGAMVSAHLGSTEAGRGAPALHAAAAVWERRLALATGFARAAAIVGGLLITGVGIPFAIRQLVRYQFLPQVVMLEGRTARDSLARSAELVRGRWWHTALVTAILNVAIGLVGVLFGLVMLLVFRDLPLWFFSALVALVYPLVVPLAAHAQVLLYGDAVAEHAADSAAEDLAAV